MENEQPSAIGAFFRGLFSGGMSGLLITAISAGVQVAAGLAAAGFWLTFGKLAIILIPTAALFAGVMAVKHVMFDAPREYERAAARSPELGTTPMIVPMVSPDLAPAPAMASPDMAPEAAPSAESWLAKTGRNGDAAQNRIQQILANGSLSDKNRAEALTAARAELVTER